MFAHKGIVETACAVLIVLAEVFAAEALCKPNFFTLKPRGVRTLAKRESGEEKMRLVPKAGLVVKRRSPRVSSRFCEEKMRLVPQAGLVVSVRSSRAGPSSFGSYLRRQHHPSRRSSVRAHRRSYRQVHYCSCYRSYCYVPYYSCISYHVPERPCWKDDGYEQRDVENSEELISLNGYNAEINEAEQNYLSEVGRLFDSGDFAEAVRKTRRATMFRPASTVLTFAYSQSLFAAGEYELSAVILWRVVNEASEKGLPVVFGHELYRDKSVLVKQINELAEKVDDNPKDTNLQLLLGYQLLGIGQVEQGRMVLKKVADSYVNGRAASALLGHAAQMKCSSDIDETQEAD
ncbi:MAG: hypothetical protein ABIG61_05085 [Planctomycetota bacterium]